MPLTARLAAVLPTEMGKDMKQSDKSLTTRQQRTQEGAPVIIRAGSGRGVLSSAHSSNFAVRGDEYSLQKIRYKIRSFRDAFGILGVPKLLIMLSCIVWTTWLIVAALAPNHTANWLMGTGDYDNGQFWVVIDKNPNITIAGAAGLACVDAAYIYVFIKTLRWRERVDTIASFIQLQPLGIKDPSTEVIKTSYMRALADLNRRWSRFYKDLTAFTGINRKFWNVVLKVFNLTMQTLVLRNLLESGNPEELVLGYATLIALNSLSCAVNILCGKFSSLTEVLIGTVIDWFAIVVYPILILVYCYCTFNFDHVIYRTYLEKLPPSSFEHQARVFADPSEVAMFRLNFDSLRIRSFLELALKIGMNLSFCYRFKQIGDVLVTSQRRKPYTLIQKPVPKAFAAFFIFFSASVWGLTYEVISNSRTNCSVHPECVAYAYRQGVGKGCPCHILIDVDRAPMMYQEWAYPVDAYYHVKALSASGELRSLQIINRQLLQLPDELRNCKNLESIELIYTSIEKLPSWTKEFTNLQFLHIEGKQESQNLLELPYDLFSNMPRLSTIQFAVHENLTTLPPLTGVPNLQSMTLAWLLSLRELPSLVQVPRLKRLVIAIMPQFEKMPDMSTLQSLKEFVITRPSHICCNGFSGLCDLNDASCVEDVANSIPAATCLNNTAFDGFVGTEMAFQKVGSTICPPLPPGFNPVASIPTKETIEMCDHRPFGQCHMPNGLEGMCYNTRMQVLACLPEPIYIALRRYQIQIGISCNSSLEEWLGCSQ